VMLPVANKPILEHLLLEAKGAGIGEFIFIVGYRDEQVRCYFGGGEKWGVSIDYCTQRRQLGTADALKMVEGMVDGGFLMMNGDSIVPGEDIKSFVEGDDIAMGVVAVADAAGLGVVELDGEKVTRIHEKTKNPPSNTANAGIYRLSPRIWPAIAGTERSPRGEYEITDSLQMMIDNGEPVRCQRLGSWVDLSYPWDLLAVNQSLLSGMEAHSDGEVEDGAVLKGEVSVGEGTVIMSGSYIVGPAAIGRDCRLGPPHRRLGGGEKLHSDGRQQDTAP